MSPLVQVQAFRVIAVAEALSWVGLLTGMYLKYLTDAGELGVKIFGPIHGGIFVAYLLLSVLVSRSMGWGRWVTVAGLACSVPPFATLAFELWAQRTGRLAASSANQEPPAVAALGSQHAARAAESTHEADDVSGVR